MPRPGCTDHDVGGRGRWVTAFYQVGYGIAAFGVGPLVDGGTSLSTIYGWTALAAAGLALLSFAVTQRQPSPQPATSLG